MKWNPSFPRFRYFKFLFEKGFQHRTLVLLNTNNLRKLALEYGYIMHPSK